MERFILCFVTTSFVIAGLFVSDLVADDAAPKMSSGETAPIKKLYQLEQLPRLMPRGTTTKMFSSYDRSGGNDDGFKGTYSKLRVEDGNSVVAEMDGAGCIQRIFLPHSSYSKPGLLGRKGEHVRIYLDGNKEPALDVPLEDIFKGKADGFPKPLVGEGSGGHYCYVPIPYRDGCKVVFEGTGVKFYAIEYTTYPNAEGVVSYQYPPTEAQREALEAAARVWSSCGALSDLGVITSEKLYKEVSLEAGQSVDIVLPEGPRMVRTIGLTGKHGVPRNNDVRVMIHWDGAKKPAVDLPLDFLFCQAMESEPYVSLLVGGTQAGAYNCMPMPYGKSATITLTAKKPFSGQFIFFTEPLAKWTSELGYFHAAYNESLPNKKGRFHPWLNREGRGHYIGTFLATQPRHDAKLPYWLEGDEVFTCDGEMRIHGTGSEDYFNCGWYGTPGRLLGPCAFPTHGFSVYRKEGKRPLAAAFRWHVSDPIPYEKNIEAKIEHGPANNSNTDYRSAAFFYDATP